MDSPAPAQAPPGLTLAALVPAPYNPRAITPEALRGLTASLKRFGDLSGLTWNRRSGYLVAGHQRLAALRTAYGEGLILTGSAEGGDLAIMTPGGERFPVRIVDMNETEELAANLTANNPAIQGVFEETQVDEMLRRVEAADAALFEELMLGGIDELFPDEQADMPTDDELLSRIQVTIKEPRTLVGVGDIWNVGPHTLVCAEVTADHERWMPHLIPGTLFAPYAGPFILFTDNAREGRVLIVQPDTYIAAHIIDSWLDSGRGGVSKHA